MKIVRESLFEVLRSEDEWANQQIAKNIERYKGEIQNKPEKKPDIENSQEKAAAVEAFRQFMMTTDPPLYVQHKQFDSQVFEINIEYLKEDVNDDYGVIVIKHEYGDNELEYEFFQTFEKAFKSIIGKGNYKNVKEVIDSAGQALYIK